VFFSSDGAFEDGRGVESLSLETLNGAIADALNPKPYCGLCTPAWLCTMCAVSASGVRTLFWMPQGLRFWSRCQTRQT